MKKNNKYFFIIAATIIFIGSLVPVIIRAQEAGENQATPTPISISTEQPIATEDLSNVTPTPSLTPTPDPVVNLDNQAEVDSQVQSEAISGDNSTVSDFSPTATPSVEPSSSPSDTAGNTGESGSNSNSPGPEITPTPSPSDVKTGDVVSQTNVVNAVNSTEVNSNVLFQTLNIYVPGDINLQTSPLVYADDIFNKNNNQDGTVNIAIVDAQNYAFLSNEIVSQANSGSAVVDGAGNISVTTGNAYSIVSLLNKVNTSFVGSTVHIVTINIFGNVGGNIILPEYGLNSGSNCCGTTINIGNDAVLSNQVNSSAISGQNTITATRGADLADVTTGSAASSVNVANIVNTTLVGVSFERLYVNLFGTWKGNFLGWNNSGPTAGGSNLYIDGLLPSGSNSCPDCKVDNLNINNHAQVENKIISSAVSGDNSVTNTGGRSTITAGNAYSAVSLINFVNSSIVNSFGFLGFINIFGNYTGDIGGASYFEKQAEPENNLNTETNGDSVDESGGKLQITQSNNVGAFVYPGDTVTFFVKIKNPGTGKIYDASWGIRLFDEKGNDLGSGIFKLGDINPGHGFDISTGLVLSKNAQPGKYIAQAWVSGYTGPENSEVSATADSSFVIKGKYLPVMVGSNETGGNKEVLGTATIGPGDTSPGLLSEYGKYLPYVLAASATIYFAIGMARRGIEGKSLVPVPAIVFDVEKRKRLFRSMALKVAGITSIFFALLIIFFNIYRRNW